MHSKLFFSLIAIGLLAVLGTWALHGLVLAQEKEQEEQEAKAYLGVYARKIDDSLAKLRDLKTTEGAYITYVFPGSPADDAGLRQGDVVIEVSGQAIKSTEDLIDAITSHKPGDRISITLLREGEMQTLQATLKEREAARRARIWTVTPPYVDKKVFFTPQFGRGRLGIEYMELNKDLGEYFGKPDGKGVLVTRVTEGSAAEKAGMKAGDVILSIDGRDVLDSEDLQYSIRRHEGEEPTEIVVLRHGERITLQAELEKGEPWGIHVFPKIDTMIKLEERLRDVNMHLQDIEICIPEIDFDFPEINIDIPDIEIPIIDIPELHGINDILVRIPEIIDCRLKILREDGDCHIWFNDREFKSLKEFEEFLKSDEYKNYQKELKEKIEKKKEEARDLLISIGSRKTTI